MQTVGEKDTYERAARHHYEYADTLLKHYINLAFQKAGAKCTGDMVAEIEAIVPSIERAVSYQIKAELAKHGISSAEGNET